MDARIFNEVNGRLASCVAAYPRHFLLFSLAISLLVSVSLFAARLEDDIRKSFSSTTSRANEESKIYKEFYNLTSLPQRSFIIFYAKDGGTILRPPQMDEIFWFDNSINEQLNITNEYDERICEPSCNANAPIQIFWEAINSVQSNSTGDDETLFAYPLSRVYGYDLFMGSSLFGVRMSDTMFENRSQIVHVNSIVLWYSFMTDTPERKSAVKDVNIRLFEQSKTNNITKFVNFNVFGDEIANSEMIRGAYEATRLMVMGFFLLLVLVFLVVWYTLRTTMVIFVVIGAVLSPFLAAMISFATIALLNFPFYSIMCITPFLILGIGVDDAFIMLKSWCQYRNSSCKNERLRKVFVEIGPSISITSITNMIAFGIGYFTPTPQMSLFCLCTSIACFADYILTFTFFAPILFLTEKDPADFQPIEGCNSQVKKDWIHRYSKFVCSWKGRAVAIIILIFLYISTIFGVSSMKLTFEPMKAFPSDSFLSNSFKDVRVIMNEFSALDIVVNRAPNISDTEEYNDFYEMISALESLPNSYGRERTMLFLKQYEAFDRKLFSIFNAFGLAHQDKYIPSYDNLDFFLSQIQNPSNIKKRRMDNYAFKTQISFVMTITSHNLTEWPDRAVYIHQCRSIVENYPQFHASIHDADAAVLDLILSVPKDLVGAIVVTVLCMSIVCLFFIVDTIGVTLVTLTISSICLTLVGSLAWWGADMDPVTMVDVLIAAGFSVDYTAHIAYRFYKSAGTIPERTEQSLREMGEPMLQAGLSTILCMLPLIFVPTYAILAFAKTIFLVVALGLLHGIFILPVFLTAFNEIARSYRDRKITRSISKDRKLLSSIVQ